MRVKQIRQSLFWIKNCRRNVLVKRYLNRLEGSAENCSEVLSSSCTETDILDRLNGLSIRWSVKLVKFLIFRVYRSAVRLLEKKGQP